MSDDVANPGKILPPYPVSLAGTLLAAREAVMMPIRPILRESGFTDQQWRVLRVLAEAGSLDASGIAERALLYPPSVTRIMRELEERGLVSRTTDAADRRRTVVAITPDGAALVRQTSERTVLVLGQIAQAFGQDRLTAYIAETIELAQTLSRLVPGDRADSPDNG